MGRLLSQIIFGTVMLILGIFLLLYESEIRAAVAKAIGESRGGLDFVDSGKVIWSIRSGGIGAIILGLFVLWMSWRG